MQTEGETHPKRWMLFSLTAHRMWGEGRGEVGLLFDADEFNAKAQRRKDAKDWRNNFFKLARACNGARRSRRFNVRFEHRPDISCVSRELPLKRRERRAPIASLRLCVFALNRF